MEGLLEAKGLLEVEMDLAVRFQRWKVSSRRSYEIFVVRSNSLGNKRAGPGSRGCSATLSVLPAIPNDISASSMYKSLRYRLQVLHPHVHL
jgi:hypothetical protein